MKPCLKRKLKKTKQEEEERGKEEESKFKTSQERPLPARVWAGRRQPEACSPPPPPPHPLAWPSCNRSHYSVQVCDREMGVKEKWMHLSTWKKGRTVESRVKWNNLI